MELRGIVLFSRTHCCKAFWNLKKVGCPNLPPSQSIHFESNRMIVKIPNVIGISVLTLLLFEQVVVNVGNGVWDSAILFTPTIVAAHLPVLALCSCRSLRCLQTGVLAWKSLPWSFAIASCCSVHFCLWCAAHLLGTHKVLQLFLFSCFYYAFPMLLPCITYLRPAKINTC